MGDIVDKGGDRARPPGPYRDRIHIQDLLARCIVGVRPAERESPQDVLINLTLGVDLSQAGQSDDLADTVDYSALKKRILASVEASEDRLIERLAQRVADLCLQDQRVGRVIVRIDKPGALRFARSVAVEIDRCREKRDHPKGSAAGRGPGAAKRTGGGA